jgi:hypothetical protein
MTERAPTAVDESGLGIDTEDRQRRRREQVVVQRILSDARRADNEARA